MSSQHDNVSWDRSHHSIFENFALDLQQFTQTGKIPADGNQDVRYSLELQKKRLQDKGLLMKYDLAPRGLLAEGGGLTKNWQDEHYISRMEYRTCSLSKSFYRNLKKVYEKKENYVFYQIITNAVNNDAVGADLYTCPNCGAVSRIADLQNGCPYCRTYFKMTDLFPKVTNFFFIRDAGATDKELRHSMGKIIFPCILLSIIGYSVYFCSIADGGPVLSSILRGIFSGVLFGVIGGYLLFALTKLCGVFWEAGKSMPMVMNTAGSEKRFVSQMKQYSPEFSYEYFSDKVVSILKMMIYSEHAQELPYYVGEPIGNLFSDIIESSYTGAVALKQFSVQGDDCYVTADVYLEDICDDGARIYQKNHTIRVYLRKNIRKPIDFHFSIKKIQCKSCGSSFDATKQRTCPSCGRRYEIEDDDWTVMKIEKR